MFHFVLQVSSCSNPGKPPMRVPPTPEDEEWFRTVKRGLARG
jgi:hypothetical protein